MRVAQTQGAQTHGPMAHRPRQAVEARTDAAAYTGALGPVQRTHMQDIPLTGNTRGALEVRHRVVALGHEDPVRAAVVRGHEDLGHAHKLLLDASKKPEGRHDFLLRMFRLHHGAGDGGVLVLVRDAASE